MSEAPERIWVLWALDGTASVFNEAAPNPGDDVPYIRADLLPQWQPIETAPRVSGRDYEKENNPLGGNLKIDEPVLLWGRPFIDHEQSLGRPRCFVGFWSAMHDRWEETMQGMTDEALAAYEIIPTHWMPLPAPPGKA